MSMVVSLSVSTEDSNYSFILIGIHSSSNTVHDSGSAVWTWDFPFSNSLFQPFSNLSRCVHLPLDPVSYLLSLVWCVWGMVHFSLWINIEMVCSAKPVTVSQTIAYWFLLKDAVVYSLRNVGTCYRPFHPLMYIVRLWWNKNDYFADYELLYLTLSNPISKERRLLHTRKYI